VVEENQHGAYDKLTPRQQRFVDAYLETWNKTAAAAAAEYAHPGQAGYRLYKVPEIRAAIDERMKQLAMPGEEVVARLTGIARSNIGDFYQIAERRYKHKVTGEEVVEVYATLDLAEAKKRGLMWLVKSHSKSDRGERIELYSAYDALIQLGKMHRLFREDATNLNLDMSDLSDEEVERIAAGEDPLRVIGSRPRKSSPAGAG
jgi:hypothetical protein